MNAPRVERVTSRSNALLAKARRLGTEPAAYRRLGEMLIEGEHLCAAWNACAATRGASAAAPGAPEATRETPPAPRLTSSATAAAALITEAGWAEPGLRRLAESAARVAVVDAALMRGIGALDSPSAIAFIVPMPAGMSVHAGRPTLVLDGIQDPGNAGTLLRSAAAFGFSQVVALTGTTALWSPKVLRAGMGAHFSLGVVEGASPGVLAELGVPMLGTSSHARDAIDIAVLPWPCAWVFGNEGRGLGAELLARCQQVVRIPQPGGQESLNVAAAAAICLYESSRQQRR